MKQPYNGLSGPHLLDYRKSYSGSVSFLKLPEYGEVSIGSPTKKKNPDVVIDGANVRPLHAIIKCSSGRSIFVPYGISSIDGIRCHEPSVLKNGAMICLGRSNYFKFYSPDFDDAVIDNKHNVKNRNTEHSEYEIACQYTGVFQWSLCLNSAFIPCMFQCEYEALMTHFTMYTYCNSDYFTVDGRGCYDFHEASSGDSCITNLARYEMPSCIDVFCPIYSVISSPSSFFRTVLCTCTYWNAMCEKLEEPCMLLNHSSSSSFSPLKSNSSSPTSCSPNVHKSSKPIIGKPTFSPSSQSKIKTNGSLPKEACTGRQQSPSAQNLGADCSQSEHDNLPQSPRTRIRTTLNSPKLLDSSPASNIGCDSDVFSYLDDVLDSGVKLCGTNDCGPSTTSPLTREFLSLSNEIRCENIGSMMQLEVQTNASAIVSTSSCIDDTEANDGDSRACLYDQLKREKLASYQRISALIQSKIRLERDESEEVASVDMEHRLLSAELQSCLEQIDTLNDAAGEKQHLLSQRQQQWLRQRGCCSAELVALSDKLNTLEQQLSRVDHPTTESNDPMNDLRSLRETLEHARKLHEDKEFVQMELEASWEADKEELNSDLVAITEQIECLNKRAEYFREQQQYLLATIRSDCDQRESTHERILHDMCVERDRLREIRAQFSRLARALTAESPTGDASMNTLSPALSAIQFEGPCQHIDNSPNSGFAYSLARDTLCASPTSSTSSRPVSASCSLVEHQSANGTTVIAGSFEAPWRRGGPSSGSQQRPLTRYMPVLHERLDLRQHVESAAHQPELFLPHVHVTSTVCRGYLHKLSGRLKAWRRRWFVFDRSVHVRSLLYYAHSGERVVRGCVRFSLIQEVYVNHGKAVRGAGSGTTFCVKTGTRTFQLMAPTAEAMRVWVDVIMTGAEGYLTLCRE